MKLFWIFEINETKNSEFPVTEPLLAQYDGDIGRLADVLEDIQRTKLPSYAHYIRLKSNPNRIVLEHDNDVPTEIVNLLMNKLGFF